MTKFKAPAKKENIPEIMAFVEQTFQKFKFKDKKYEESVNTVKREVENMVKYAYEDSQIQVKMKKEYSTATIKLSCSGDEFSENDQNTGILNHEESKNVESGKEMRTLLKEAFAGNISYSHRGETNYVKVFIGHKERMFAIKTLSSFGLAIGFCLVAAMFMPEEAMEWCVDNIFAPIQTLFLNALKLVTAPAVFFSIMTAVARFASFGDLQRVGKKSIFGHIFSAVIAIVIGSIVFYMSGSTDDITGILSDMVDQSASRGHSVLDTITKSIPDNMIDPFLNVDALQLLMLALICGIALAKAGNEVPILNDIATALHKFFKTAVDIITSIIPFAVFFVTTLMIFMFGFASLFATLRIFIMVVIGFVLLMLISVLFVAIFGRLNPITFVRKMWPHMLRTFWSGSSISQAPKTMEICEKDFGVSPKVYKFTIPFGSIADLDGNCLYMTICGLFLSGVCGVDVLGTNFFTIAFMVMVLSIGSAITPGSAMLALIILMGQMGVSLTIICIILGINPILELFLAMSNNLREVASTLVIARNEKLIDLNVYKNKSYSKVG